MSGTLIDTDAGVDDMLALFLLYSLAPPVTIDVAVTFGNVPLDRAIRNVGLLSYISGKRPRQVLRGAVGPLHGKVRFAQDVHGIDGLGGVTGERYRDAPETIETADFASASKDYDRMIATGPLTDISDLAARNNTAPLCIMGGAFEHPGNMSPYAEFNTFCDPDGAAKVYATWDADIHVVPLDLSHQVVLQRAWLKQTSECRASPIAAFLNEIHQFYMDVYGTREGIDGCHPHDALAVFAAFFPDAFAWRRGRVHVVTEGVERGRTVLTPDPAGRHYVAQSVDQARFFATLERAFSQAS